MKQCTQQIQDTENNIQDIEAAIVEDERELNELQDQIPVGCTRAQITKSIYLAMLTFAGVFNSDERAGHFDYREEALAGRYAEETRRYEHETARSAAQRAKGARCI